METPIDCDVIVIGLGPSGLMATAFLAQMGWRIVAVEKHEGLYGLPRAGHVDHEIVRFLQQLGQVEAFLDDAYPIGSYRWYNGHGDVLLEMDWGGTSASGFNSDYMMYQPVLDDALAAAAQRCGDAVVSLRGHVLTGFSQDSDGVTASVVRAANVTSERAKTIRGRYLLAADGARSGIRDALGVTRADLGFNETWLDCDVRVKRPLPAMDPHQICDPVRPIFISPLGKRHHRFEWAILPGEDPADFDRAETAWRLLAAQGVGPEDVEIVRQQVYTFEARVAERWRLDRALLLGDAAHTMPPQMGQGACSGMRDAVNLAWKLDLILRGAASDVLLDSYQIEREPHTRTWIDLSIRAGEISCTLDPEEAARRDALLLSGKAPPAPAFPDLTAGILLTDASGKAVAPTGLTFPQRTVQTTSASGLLDDLAGRGFRLVALDRDPRPDLTQRQRAILDLIGARTIVIADVPRDDVFGDEAGFYRAWLMSHRTAMLLVRPDHYVFGAVRGDDTLGVLFERLEAALHLHTGATR